MVDAAVLFGANKTTAERDLRSALQFEMELAKVALIYIIEKWKNALNLIWFLGNCLDLHF